MTPDTTAANSRRTRSIRRAALSLGGALLLTSLLAGCAAPASPADPGDAIPVEPDGGTGAEQPAIPEELEVCAEKFPQAFELPDTADVEILPGDWPAAPDGSTLCLTSEGFGEPPMESLSYVTDASPEEIVAYYESALAAYALERSPGAGGEMLSGSGAGIGFQIQPAEGSFVIALAPAE